MTSSAVWALPPSRPQTATNMWPGIPWRCPLLEWGPGTSSVNPSPAKWSPSPQGPRWSCSAALGVPCRDSPRLLLALRPRQTAVGPQGAVSHSLNGLCLRPQDPYFMKNHLGSYECKLCLTLHNNEVSSQHYSLCGPHPLPRPRRQGALLPHPQGSY